MHIAFIEIANFRKLLSTRLDIDTHKTIIVGANNSGKTSTMLALQKFLSRKNHTIDLNDFTLCHLLSVNNIGFNWIEARNNEQYVELSRSDWTAIVPTLDLWLNVEESEFHYVRDIIPTLAWGGGKLGVRMRFEPFDLANLHDDFLTAYDAAEKVRTAATHAIQTNGSIQTLKVWPCSLSDFLRRRLSDYFKIQEYVLDPAAITPPQRYTASPQIILDTALPINSDSLKNLIRVDEIPAQRGFADAQSSNDDDKAIHSNSMRLTEQLRRYYNKHLSPENRSTPEDLDALQAIEDAQNAFDQRLTECFAEAFQEIRDMGYPGVTDPRPNISTRLRVTDTIDHASAVSFDIDAIMEDGSCQVMRLPEDHNGLGYQNLLWMTFRLMGFRDAWMHVGKDAGIPGDYTIEPLHVVLIEEPEAYLHAQVQQVFINNAYATLRKHPELGEKTLLSTQLIVSTHSSHIAHEIPFSCMRYFRRLPAGVTEEVRVPISTVVNLSDVFGVEEETEQFVTRYLRAQHCDLFFADAVIIVEGSAERMLLPHFIHARHPHLEHCYLTILDIGGSHAHKLQNLIEKLGLPTLVITDIDSANADGKSTYPNPQTGQITKNPTLKTWLPKLSKIDELYAADAAHKIRSEDDLCAVRVAYQTPFPVTIQGKNGVMAYPHTFEDALAFENLDFFETLEGVGLAATFQKAIAEGENPTDIESKIWKALHGSSPKAQLALDIIAAPHFDTLKIPNYIEEGLQWLEDKLRKNQAETLPSSPSSKDMSCACTSGITGTQEMHK